MQMIWRQIRPHLSRLVRFLHISYLETKSEYQGTVLGIAWIPISTILFSLLLALVFHPGSSGSPQLFFLYVLVGYSTWTFIADTIRGSVDIIQSKLDFAVHRGLSLVGLFGKLLIDRLFGLGMNLAVILIAAIVLNPFGLGWHTLLLGPVVVILSLTALSISYLVNLTTIIVPDLANVVKTGVRLMFFATPIFWTTGSKDGIRLALEQVNPASYFLRMTREVFGIEQLNWSVWAVCVAICAVLCLASYAAFVRSHNFVRNVK